MAENWIDLGLASDLQQPAQRVIDVSGQPVVLSYVEGTFGAVSGVCNHVGGPLGKGTLDGKYLTCPWHYWKFHFATGEGEPGFEADCVPSYALKQENGHLLISARPVTRRNHLPHPPHALARKIEPNTGALRVAGISTTAMDPKHPRYSGSESLLERSLAHARAAGAETRLLRLSDLHFRNCEGFYSKSARACTWPCSITQMDPKDQMDQVYEAFVHWADVILVATPIRWGSPSSLYFKMVERMNCVQNQVTIANRVLLRNKVAGFIIIGGQDNVQGVAGQMLAFFSEIGCVFPQFPFIAHSRGWTAEDMEKNEEALRHSDELRRGADQLASRCLEMALQLRSSHVSGGKVSRGGRKAFDPADH